MQPNYGEAINRYVVFGDKVEPTKPVKEAIEQVKEAPKDQQPGMPPGGGY